MSRPDNRPDNGVRASFCIVVLFLTLATMIVSGPAPAAAAETQITDGQLTWNVKESWRKYIGIGSQAGGGAEVTEWVPDANGDPLYPAGFKFPVRSGTFDDETNTSVLRFEGFVHFQSWCGHLEPGKCALDTKFSDLELKISPDVQVLRGTHTGYDRADPGGDLHVDENVVLAKFDLSGATTDFSGGKSRWSGIPTVAGPGFNIYGESTVLDETSFEYTGPGGPPDLSEHWDTPGSPGIESAGAWLAEANSGARALYPSPGGEVVHTVDLAGVRTTGAKLILAARDPETLESVGTPFQWNFPGAVTADRQSLRTAYDAATDSIFFVTFHDGEARNQTTVRRARWNATTQGYEVDVVGSLGTVLTVNRRVRALAWNPIKRELAAIAFAGATGDPYSTDLLHRFRPDGGSWVHEQTPLRSPDTGVWAAATSVTSPFGINTAQVPDERALAVARDGSYVVASGAGRTIDAGSTSHYYPALHVSIGSGGAAQATPIEGTITRTSPGGSYYGFNSLSEAPDGSLLLHNSVQLMDGFVRIDVTDGIASKVGEIFEAPADAFPPTAYSNFANSIAADTANEITWVTDPFDPEGFRLNAMRGEELIGRYPSTEFPASAANGAFSRLAVGPEGSIYMPIRDAESGRLGFRRFGFNGFVPEVVSQPEGRSIALGIGQTSKEVGFSVDIGDSEGEIQWQKRPLGQSSFTDIVGQAGTSLTVVATPADDGTLFRAKVGNAAGTIVSDVATLSVTYAPVVLSDLSDRSVTEGADALFALNSDGNPEPAVSWQRRIGGFWQNIEPGDDNYLINGPSLTIRDANTEQSGSLFRAKLVNAVATVHSRAARLTVVPEHSIPPEGIDLEKVNLDWTGNMEIQKAPPFGAVNYLSAGISDGTEAGYRSSAENVQVFQVPAPGTENKASWSTRRDHLMNGGRQLVRLYGGTARIEPDGSARIRWKGSFSVNFYGGMVPFTVTDPELSVDAAGSGSLKADLDGCVSSQADPNRCAPLDAVNDVTVSTFSGVEIDPTGEVSIQPDYKGVSVGVPVGSTLQNRSVEGWGAWPQAFVDFQVKTGLSSYWYSSGGAADEFKPPNPVLVDFTGAVKPGGPTDPEPEPKAKPSILVAKGIKRVNRAGWARVATLVCPNGAACRVAAPKRIVARVRGRRYSPAVSAPRTMRAGTRAGLRVRLPRAAVKRLKGHRATLKLRVTIRSEHGGEARWVRVRIKAGG